MNRTMRALGIVSGIMNQWISWLGRPGLVKVCGLGLVVLAASVDQGQGGTLHLAVPDVSAHRITLAGAVTNNRGIAVMMHQSNPGHLVTSSNTPQYNRAYVYMMGREKAQYTHRPVWSVPLNRYVHGVAAANTSTESAVGSSVTGMPETSDFFAEAGRHISNLTFQVGYRAGKGVDDSWNLMPDALNTNYYCATGDTVEERLYQADEGDVVASFAYMGETVLEFGYSPLKMIIDYRTASLTDDVIQAYSHPVSYTIPDGLAGDAQALADALDQDIQAGGGSIQLFYDTIQTTSREDYITEDDEDLYGVFSFTGSFMAVPGLVKPLLNFEMLVGELEAGWVSSNHVIYHVQARTNLVAGVWEDAVEPIIGNGEPVQVELPLPSDQDMKFWRLMAEPQ